MTGRPTHDLLIEHDYDPGGPTPAHECDECGASWQSPLAADACCQD